MALQTYTRAFTKFPARTPELAAPHGGGQLPKLYAEGTYKEYKNVTLNLLPNQ